MGGDGDLVPSVDSWSDADQRIVVSSKPGFLWNVLLRARINGAPDDVYNVLTDEHPERIFRGIKAVTNRKVVQEDRRTGKRTLELTHRAFTKFLCFTVTFDTHLFVDEDPKQRTIHFRTAREGFMKMFDGQWTIQPFTQHTLDNVFGDQHHHNLLHNMGGLFQGLFQPSSAASLVTLEQSIEPKSRPPRALQGLVNRMLANQVQDLMADVRKEVKRQEQDALATTKEANPLKRAHAAGAACMTLAAAPSLEALCSPLCITVHL